MEGMGGSITAVLIGVWATFALDVFSTLNSSPQTTEIFAGDREESLMFWVAIGLGVAVGGGLAASVISGKAWPLIATMIVAGGMYYTYKLAVKRGAGQAPPASATES
jgi:hypothetical protein